MPLLGGAGKMGGGSTANEPRFTGGNFVANDFATPPFEATAEIELLGDGTVWRRLGQGSDAQIGRWDNGLGTLTIGDYDFRADIVAGSPNSPGSESANVWIVGHVMRWGVEEDAAISNFNFTLRVRPTGGGADYDTNPCFTYAEATP